MKAVKIENIHEFLTEGTECLGSLKCAEKEEGIECLLPMEGGGLDVTPLVKGSQRYLSFYNILAYARVHFHEQYVFFYELFFRLIYPE